MTYGPNGALSVYLTTNGQPIEVADDSRTGMYGASGALRVVFVGGAGVLLADGETEVEIGPTTYTITVTDGVITDIQSA